MIREVSIYGIYVPGLLLLSLVALAATRALARILAWFGVYRLVWHSALFDVALFVIMLAVFDFLTSRWF